MLTTFQFGSQNMLEHGNSVLNAYLKLKDMITSASPEFESITGLNICQGTQLLSEITEAFEYDHCDSDDFSRARKLSSKAFNTYLIYHDCGKPDSLVVDDEGKQHFPDHANVSANKFYLHAMKHISGDALDFATRLIRKDMCFHALKGDELKSFINEDPDAYALLLSAWASLISNSEMFGGMESDSFKIKAKKLKKAGKWLFKEEN